jgi:hypothetical protein
MYRGAIYNICHQSRGGNACKPAEGLGIYQNQRYIKITQDPLLFCVAQGIF